VFDALLSDLAKFRSCVTSRNCSIRRKVLEMPRIVDSKATRAGVLAHRLLGGYVRNDPTAIDHVTAELTREDDPELLLLVLSRAVQVSAEILVMLAVRVGANPARAIDDAFVARPPR
jgi:hypothetical protein